MHSADRTGLAAGRISTHRVVSRDRVYFLQPPTIEAKGCLLNLVHCTAKFISEWHWSRCLCKISVTVCSQLASLTLWLVGGGQGFGCVEGGRVHPNRFGAMHKSHLQSGGQLAGMRQSKGSRATSHWSEDSPVCHAGNPLLYICWLSNTLGLYVVPFSATPPLDT